MDGWMALDLLNQIDAELLKEDPNIGRVREMLAVLSAKKKTACVSFSA